MKITRDNYEIWFLDYLEERLDPQQREMVRLFLAGHPDLAEELESFAPALTCDNELIYPEKELLKRTAFDDSVFLENQLVAAMEGDLAEEDHRQLDHWLANRPAQQDIAQLFYKCRLVPDPDIHFPQKEQLKKKSVLRGYFIRIAAVAAVLLVAFSLFNPAGDEGEPATLAKTEQLILPPQELKADPLPQQQNTASTMVVKTKYMHRAATIAPPVNDSNLLAQEKVQTDPLAEVVVEELKPRSIMVTSDIAQYTELVPPEISETANLSNVELPLSEIMKNRAQTLQAEETAEFFSRRKILIAGLKLFSKLPGNNLTGKKGEDGRLKAISLNTQLLAVSIPIKRQL